MVGAEDLRDLGAGRWTVPLLARLLAEDGARFAVLVAGLGIARDSLVRALAQAIGLGWVQHNTGYGHPLRPEYVLTERGEAVAHICARMMAVRVALNLGPQSLPRWALPILRRLEGGEARFSDLLADLAPVTPRALSINLKQMMQNDILFRRLEEGFPPGTSYGLAYAGRSLVQAWQPA